MDARNGGRRVEDQFPLWLRIVRELGSFAVVIAILYWVFTGLDSRLARFDDRFAALEKSQVEISVALRNLSVSIEGLNSRGRQ